MLKVVTVYKSGGDLDPVYVKRLADGVKRNLSVPYEFFCLSDISEEQLGVKVIPLRHNWPNWWAKMELFSLEGPLLYFDLDTAIVGSIDQLANRISELNQGVLVMLRGFYRADQCSGIMGWNGSLFYVYERFRIIGDQATYRAERHGVSMAVGNKRFRGDQEWLRELCRQKQDQIAVIMAQDIMPEIYSYKVDILPLVPTKELMDAKIVCFHGHPRPHEIAPKPKWLVENWG